MINNRNILILGDEDYITWKKCIICNDFKSPDIVLPFNFNFITENAKRIFCNKYLKAKSYYISYDEYDVIPFSKDDNYNYNTVEYFIINYETLQNIEELIYDNIIIPNIITTYDYGNYINCSWCNRELETISTFLYLLEKHRYR
mgnify:CR=1 FL=1